MDAETREKIKAVFRRSDENGDGVLSIEELQTILKSLNPEFTDADIAKVFGEIDVNADGKVQYEEFVDWVAGPMDLLELVGGDVETPEGKIHAAVKAEVGGPHWDFELVLDCKEEPDWLDVMAGLRLFNARQLRDVFTDADVEKSGDLKLEQIKGLLYPSASGAASGAESTTVAKVFAQMDKNKDGKIQCGEFVSYILETKKCLSSVPSDADKKQIADAFSKADVDRGGSITVDELQAMLGAETEGEKEMVKQAFNAVDVNGCGKLSIIEFSRMYGKELVMDTKGIEVQGGMDAPDEEESEEEG